MTSLEQDSCRIVSLNIEGHKHLDKIIPFFESVRSDVICIQEIFETDFSYLKRVLRVGGIFVPMTKITMPNFFVRTWLGNRGLGIFTTLPIVSSGSVYYGGNGSEVPEYVHGNPDSYRRIVLHATVRKGDTPFRIGTTHFVWTPHGDADDIQKKDVKALLRVLETLEDFVLSGDFNAPRGKEIFETISSLYKDNIPPYATTTLDARLHRAGNLQLVVDGLFSTPGYHVEGVELVGGLSDHYAVVGTIRKK